MWHPCVKRGLAALHLGIKLTHQKHWKTSKSSSQLRWKCLLASSGQVGAQRERGWGEVPGSTSELSNGLAEESERTAERCWECSLSHTFPRGTHTHTGRSFLHQTVGTWTIRYGELSNQKTTEDEKEIKVTWESEWEWGVQTQGAKSLQPVLSPASGGESGARSGANRWQIWWIKAWNRKKWGECWEEHKVAKVSVFKEYWISLFIYSTI